MGMKTAVSIPDEVFAEAERLRRRMDTSRSELYSRALREFVARHGPDHVTEALDQIHGEFEADASLAKAAAEQTLKRTGW